MKVSELWLLKQIGSWSMEIANPPEVKRKVMYEQRGGFWVGMRIKEN